MLPAEKMQQEEYPQKNALTETIMSEVPLLQIERSSMKVDTDKLTQKEDVNSLRQERDGQLPTATYYWSRLPSIQYYNYYYFNVTNPDEVLYYGKKARLVESVVYMKHQQNLGKVANMVLNGLLLLLGESPLRAVTQGGASFESYPDPLITLINSNLTKTLMAILGNSVPLPNIPAMGFFPLEHATVEDFYKVGEVRILVNTSMAMNINSFEQLRPDSNVCG
ncbi:hypothetical protein NECAME_08282 [Necator americanus]|uniref:Uncharacterized protein n=1 Tax=Necator americanus TaxID=51031 RepID=W2TL36_NECAM|nr:hypothetical protein NECAME_08282 [Necator americanus]ETN81742.1 hypothetical protein NECAME_08282 [Necator americanus]